MHCPKCGQQQISDEIRYCSRCGFLLTGIAEVVANEGHVPGSVHSGVKRDSPRKRGVKQGAFIFLLSILIVPVLLLLSIAIQAGPGPSIFATILLIAGGLLRIAYALMFESAEPGGAVAEQNALSDSRNFLGRRSKHAELPHETESPTAIYVAPGTGTWRDTNDLVPAPSVTDSTTKLLKDDERKH